MTRQIARQALERLPPPGARARAWGPRGGAAGYAGIGQRGQEYAAIRLEFYTFLPHLQLPVLDKDRGD